LDVTSFCIEESHVTETPAATSLRIPACDVPIPSSVSAEAQAALAAMAVAEPPSYPEDSDPDVWRAFIDAGNEIITTMLGQHTANLPVQSEAAELGGVPAHRLVPDGVDPADGRVYLSLHGGALVMGAGDACEVMSKFSATRVGALTWAVDYRMPPDDPFPAGLDDCVAAYRALLDDYRPEQIVVGGESAGGNLAAALVLRARDEGLPEPAAAVLLTPELDLTESGDTFQTNRGMDTILGRTLMPANLIYADGHDLADPYVSPLFGDFGKGFPPTLLSAGTRDLFLSNAVRMHRALRAADVEAELHVLEAAPHGGFFGMAREDAELDREVRRFVDARWA
jgi:acetyl esterase/lipase